MRNPDISGLDSINRPYFTAKFVDGITRTSGEPQCQLGHKLAHQTRHGHEGIFVQWTWDGESLSVKNDRYGIYPLFYSCHEEEIRVSPSIEQILDSEVPRTLDHNGLAVLFRLGHFVGEDTPFEHIRVLPPNSTLTWRAGQMEIRRNCRDRGFCGRQSISFDDAVATYIDLFDRAIARRPPADERFTIPISGGRDSRHILLALDKAGIKPAFCPTLEYRPPATNDDLRIAGMLCKRLNIEHVRIGRPPSWFDAVLKDISLTNYCGGAHSWSLPLAAYLTGRVNTIYDGLAGSVLSGGFMLDQTKLDLCRKGRLEELAVTLLREARKEAFNKTILTPAFLSKSTFDGAIARLVSELSRHVEADNPVLSFIFWNRTRRSVGSIPFAIMSGIDTVFCPYLDHEVFDFLSTLDPAMFMNNRLHDAAIARGYPQHADIPFEDKTRRATVNSDALAYYRHAVRRFAHYLMKRPTWSSELVRARYVYPRVLYDLLMRRGVLPWYLISTLYALELEQVHREN